MQRPSCSEPKIDDASETLEMESALAIFPTVYGRVFGKVTNEALETAMGALEPPLLDVKLSPFVVPEASNAFLFRFLNTALNIKPSTRYRENAVVYTALSIA